MWQVYKCQGLFLFFLKCRTFACVFKAFAPLQKAGGCFRDILKHLRKNFSAVSIKGQTTLWLF